ncbi:hypothetical protein BZL30_7743 [Mycobacterium kansasii]|uniref:Uncharacterized protein n=1 Tax=Mycobacterium kansasii TaxID=1768 RepID=A0A1V3WK90_MYCKA|nr:hypothetical protein BZL30_7743 [Mycobacterium kansasii]
MHSRAAGDERHLVGCTPEVHSALLSSGPARVRCWSRRQRGIR